QDGILEAYWGEHIHLGYYTPEELKKGFWRKDLIQSKVDFIDEMMKWGGVDQALIIFPAWLPHITQVLDVGCGFGGTSRYLAKTLGPQADVLGITLSKQQVKRGTELAEEAGITNAKFQVTDALDMPFEDGTFDVVWACESGEHMPDKKLYVEEMTRVLKPGGNIVIGTWCQRDDTEVPFSEDETKRLQYMYDQWSHPPFISIKAYENLMLGTGALEQVATDDWCEETKVHWRHTILKGITNPLPGLKALKKKWWKTLQDLWCIERYAEAFNMGLMVSVDGSNS
ncbi:unnamed protein product, partial [Chrysoparadoxa australica]